MTKSTQKKRGRAKSRQQSTEQDRVAGGERDEPLGLGVLSIGPAEPAEWARQHMGPPSPIRAARERLKSARGNPKPDFLEALLVEIELACTQDGALDITSYNLVVSIIEADQPQDLTEAMISTLKGLIFRQCTRSMHLLRNSDTEHHQNLAERQQAKLAGTFMNLALGQKQYHSRTQSQVTVQNNVLINEGHKTIVSTAAPTVVEQEPVSNSKAAATSPALTDESGMAMPPIDQHKVGAEIANENAPDCTIPTAPPLTASKAPLTPRLIENKERVARVRRSIDQ